LQPEFGDTITIDRPEPIFKFLHFANSKIINNFLGQKKHFQIVSVISHLNNRFQELYVVNPDASIDESLILWKGHVSFKQQFSLKASEF
jgi:hypothetical protein